MFQLDNPGVLYNKCPVAGSPLGRKDSEETRAKKSRALKGRKQSPQVLAARLEGVRSPESREKISKAGKGRKKTKEQIEKVRLANLGVPKTEEAKRKMSIAALNRSEQAKQNIAEAAKIRAADPEYRNKISQTLTGRKLTQQHVLNMARGHALLSLEQAEEVRQLRSLGWKRKALAEKFKCSESTIKKIINPNRGSVAYAVSQSTETAYNSS